MDLSFPYATLVPSLDGPVLQVLARSGKPLSGRQIQRIAERGSVPGVARVLDRLVDSGLVVAERTGAAILYSVNRDHLVWPAVDTIMSLREDLFGRIAATVRDWRPLPAKAVVFGSAARADGGPDSDIDILLVHGDDEPSSWADEQYALGQQIARWTGNHAQFVIVDERRWQDMIAEGDPLVRSVERDGVDLLALVPSA
ncbi:nucleotidyltransferase-like protein [Nocardioides albertanoniae]|uniref:Nucleotidyltransferase-like protein n=1 Tax=Nocardioides albertanoniae TaxID=1175486 RepID=A0A543A285_9ACTN|nr:nucleotidyltransferase domain-containing protein [Nocardioides albertanoniae]TQL66703.1 nucleotidyltransferase-like protein [Nocardioides albertanoniae]